MSEIMSEILGLELGNQQHNSDSLHVYTESPMTFDIYDNFLMSDGDFVDIYDRTEPFRFNFNFKSEKTEERLDEVDKFQSMIIGSLREGEYLTSKQREDLYDFSSSLALIYELLKVYVSYKFETDKGRKYKIEALQKIAKLRNEFVDLKSTDIVALSQNFFVKRLGSLDDLSPEIRSSLIFEEIL
jgi:hypothetical protein